MITDNSYLLTQQLIIVDVRLVTHDYYNVFTDIRGRAHMHRETANENDITGMSVVVAGQGN